MNSYISIYTKELVRHPFLTSIRNRDYTFIETF